MVYELSQLTAFALACPSCCIPLRKMFLCPPRSLCNRSGTSNSSWCGLYLHFVSLHCWLLETKELPEVRSFGEEAACNSGIVV